MRKPQFNHVLNSDYPELSWRLEGDYAYEKIEWELNEDQTAPTKEELESKLATLQAEYDSKQYQRDRADAYPELKEQLDLLWHAIDDGKFNVKSKDTDFYKKLKAVKDANPKPE